MRNRMGHSVLVTSVETFSTLNQLLIQASCVVLNVTMIPVETVIH